MAETKKPQPFKWFGRPQGMANNLLKDFLTSTDHPLGTIVMQGHDLTSMLAREPNTDLLLGAFARAREAKDYYWQLQIGDILIEKLGFSADIVANQLDTLIEAGLFDQAAKLLPHIDPAAHDEDQHTVWQACVAEGRGELETFHQQVAMYQAEITQAKPDRAPPLIQALLARGEYTLALALIEGLPVATDFNTVRRLAELRLEATALLDGPKAARTRLESMCDLFPPSGSDYLAAFARILMFQGRYPEACEQLKRAIHDAPGRADLYPLLQKAAFSADNRAVFDNAVDRLAVIDDDHMVVLMQRLEQLGNDAICASQATQLLNRIRRKSEWQFQIASLLRASDNKGPSTVHKAFADAIAAHVPPRVCRTILANYEYYIAIGQTDLANVVDLLAACGPRFYDHPSDMALYLRLLIATGEAATAAKLLNTCSPGLLNHAAITPFTLYFQMLDGQHEACKAGWQDYLRWSGSDVLSSVSAPPQEVTCNYQPSEDAILLFGVVFNGVEYIHWFLNHYRSLGVDHFFLVDNGSQDGTFAVLEKQPDVSLHYQPGSFSAAKCGVVWINHLIQRFGVGHWCLHVDIDEALTFEGAENGRTIKDLTASMQAEGAESLGAFMLDIYPESIGDIAGEDLFASSRCIDDDYVFLPYELPPYQFVKGGIRGRLAGQSMLMTKAPLVRVHRGFAYTLNNHHHTHLPVSKERGALMHYKFIGDALGRVDEAVERGEHYLGAKFYQTLQKPLANGTLKDRQTILHAGEAQLKQLGYIGPLPDDTGSGGPEGVAPQMGKR